MSPGSIGKLIEHRLRKAFDPLSLKLKDESGLHRGHAEARSTGETHFHVHIVSRHFTGRSLVERHKLVNAALADMLQARIHALSISARAPGEEPATQPVQ